MYLLLKFIIKAIAFIVFGFVAGGIGAGISLLLGAENWDTIGKGVTMGLCLVFLGLIWKYDLDPILKRN